MGGQCNILLCDLAYLHGDDYVHPFPLNIGYIASYAKKTLKDVAVEILKDPQELYEIITNGKILSFDIVAFSNYDWNSNLNKLFLGLIKHNNNRIIAVMGGPNIEISTDEDIIDTFLFYGNLDYYIVGPGEYPFVALVEAITANVSDEHILEFISENTLQYSQTAKTFRRGRRPHAQARLDDIPSPYLTGLLDKFFLDNHLVPIIETSRGCPYHCAYCYWGSAVDSAVQRFPEEIVKAEIEYISLRSTNPNKSLYITDGNFGINKRDVELSQFIQECSVKYGYPKSIYMYFNKNFNEQLLKISNILKDLTEVSMSKQSLNPETLEAIGRKNIDNAKYLKFLQEMIAVQAKPYCELIYPLPKETYATFLSGFAEMSALLKTISIYPLVMIKGAKINSKSFREEHKISTKYRIIPRYSGVYGSLASVEYEEIVVSTDSFSFDDFLKVRAIQFLYYIFKEEIFSLLSHYLTNSNSNVVKYIIHLLKDKQKWPLSFLRLFGEFVTAIQSEFLAKEDTLKPVDAAFVENVRSSGLALNIYYFSMLIEDWDTLDSFRQYLIDSVADHLDANPEQRAEIEELISFCIGKIIRFKEKQYAKTITSPYEFQKWQSHGSVPLKNFKKLSTYSFSADKALIELFEQNLSKAKTLHDAIYKTRMNVIAHVSNAYTYIVTEVPLSEAGNQLPTMSQ